MSSSEAAGTARSASRYDIAGLIADLGDIPVVTDTTAVRRRSRDFFWYSPILNEQLQASPPTSSSCRASEADVIATVAACARRRIPLTPRGGDRQLRPGGAARGRRAARHVGDRRGSTGRSRAWCGSSAGAKLRRRRCRAQAARAGSCACTRRPSAPRRSAASSPADRAASDRSPMAACASRATSSPAASSRWRRRRACSSCVATQRRRSTAPTAPPGIITALEMPLAPAWPWIDVVVAFDDFYDAVAGRPRAGARRRHRQEAPLADQMAAAVIFRSDQGSLPGGQEPARLHDRRERARELQDASARARRGLRCSSRWTRAPAKMPLYEYTWNHTTLQVSEDRPRRSPTCSASIRTTG